MLAYATSKPITYATGSSIAFVGRSLLALACVPITYVLLAFAVLAFVLLA
jgi:hypothetical protein